MSELSYPRFPWRALASAGAVLVAFSAAVIVVNSRAGPNLRGCAIAAERVMVARSYTADMMRLAGPGQLPACHGLTARQFARALLRTYEIEYGGRMPPVPASNSVPPPAYKALSARSQAQVR